MHVTDTELGDLPLFTKGFAGLISCTNEEILLDSFLRGIPESTQSVLGKPGFSIQDLLDLPRLPDDVLAEHTAYLDALEYGSNEWGDGWRLYVGAATGEFGSLRRWYDYFCSMCKTRHGQASAQRGRKMNLRCIAHYGTDPPALLTIFAEGILMIYLGTVDDPGYRRDDYSRFINDNLYKLFQGYATGLRT
jgi:hypothetical protein